MCPCIYDNRRKNNIYMTKISHPINYDTTRVNIMFVLFVTGIFYVIIEYCRFGCLRQYIIDKQHDFIDTMDDECKRDAAMAKQEAQPRIPPVARYANVIADNDNRAKCTIDINGDMAPLTTKDLVCYLFQIARGMEFLASRKVGAAFGGIQYVCNGHVCACHAISPQQCS